MHVHTLRVFTYNQLILLFIQILHIELLSFNKQERTRSASKYNAIAFIVLNIERLYVYIECLKNFHYFLEKTPREIFFSYIFYQNAMICRLFGFFLLLINAIALFAIISICYFDINIILLMLL